MRSWKVHECVDKPDQWGVATSCSSTHLLGHVQLSRLYLCLHEPTVLQLLAAALQIKCVSKRLRSKFLLISNTSCFILSKWKRLYKHIFTFAAGLDANLKSFLTQQGPNPDPDKIHICPWNAAWVPSSQTCLWNCGQDGVFLFQTRVLVVDKNINTPPPLRRQQSSSWLS